MFWASKYVVTAAHCVILPLLNTMIHPRLIKVRKKNRVKKKSLLGLYVRLGEHNISDSAEEILARKDISVKRVTVHEAYNPTLSHNNDRAG